MSAEVLTPLRERLVGACRLLSGSDKAKLDGIETGATADQTAAEILTAVKTVDGAASGLDADLLDGLQATAFETAGAEPLCRRSRCMRPEPNGHTTDGDDQATRAAQHC